MVAGLTYRPEVAPCRLSSERCMFKRAAGRHERRPAEPLRGAHDRRPPSPLGVQRGEGELQAPAATTARRIGTIGPPGVQGPARPLPGRGRDKPFQFRGNGRRLPTTQSGGPLGPPQGEPISFGRDQADGDFARWRRRGTSAGATVRRGDGCATRRRARWTDIQVPLDAISRNTGVRSSAVEAQEVPHTSHPRDP